MSKQVPVVGMRVKCRGHVGTVSDVHVTWFEVDWDDGWDMATVSMPGTANGGWWDLGEITPIDAPAPAAPWVPARGVMVNVCGTVLDVSSVNGRAAVKFNGVDSPFTLVDINALRPEAAPSPPREPFAGIDRPGGAWDYRKQIASLEAELAAAQALIANRPGPGECAADLRQELATMRARRDEAVALLGKDQVHAAMRLGDYHSQNDRLSARLAEKEQELGTLTRERDRLATELRKANDKLRKVGRL